MRISNGFATWHATTALAMVVGLMISGCGEVNDSAPRSDAQSGSAAIESAAEELAMEELAPQDSTEPLSTPSESELDADDNASGGSGFGGSGFGGGGLGGMGAGSVDEAASRQAAPSVKAPAVANSTEVSGKKADGAPFFGDAPVDSAEAASRESSQMNSELQPVAASADGSKVDEMSSELSILQDKVVEERLAPRLESLGQDVSRGGESLPAMEKKAVTQRFGRDAKPQPGEIAGGQQDQKQNRSLFFESPASGPTLSPDRQKALLLDLQPGEELWIIAKAVDRTQPSPDADTPRCGCLMATLPGETKEVPVPLKHTSVEGQIDGYIATVNVQQQFHNPYDSKIEAVYVFPLPESAAVNEFVMTVGDRKIRGIIQERDKAEKIYAAARAQGHVASLMTQERANIFTQKVANIEPGKQIDINIRYFNTLQYDDGAYEFVFPMVVGPRFNPPASGGNGVGAVPRNASGSSGQATEVSYLSPTERSGHDISLSLNISAGVDIEGIRCVNHRVDVQDICESQKKVTLASGDTIPNKDFVLRYTVAGDQIKTALLTHEDKNGKYFTMMLYPPADLAQVNRSPMEMVFVLDCSGSMRGQPIAQAKAAIRHAVQSLTPRDTFQIIRFSNNASQLGPEPVLATEENIKRGLEYLASLNGSGGTQMIEGIKAALDFPHDEGRFRLVSFMTDGFIGNEQQILGTMYDKLGASRVFSFGVGSSPNRMLMNRMAILGRGAATYLSLNDDAVSIMDRFNRRISHPAMTDLSIDWGDMNVADVYPQRLPDLIVGRPVVITGRFEGEPSTVSVNGRVDMEPKVFTVALDEDGAQEEHAGIAAVWARLKIKDMMNVATHAPEAATEIQTAVTQTALAYNLMSAFTAFVAVDSLTKTDGDYGTTVAVPVPVPEGVKYETTVGAQN